LILAILSSPAIKELPITLECKVLYKQKQVLENIVPLHTELRQRQAKRLGLDKLKFYQLKKNIMGELVKLKENFTKENLEKIIENLL